MGTGRGRGLSVRCSCLQELPVSALGLTAAHLAAALGNVRSIQLLQHNGENLSGAHSTNGSTPAHYAARFGRIPVLAELLHFGIPLDARDCDSRTPEAVARQFEQPD